MRWLFLFFIVLPAAELWLLFRIGARIGALPTFGLIVVTGIVGASLARHQGLGVIQRIQSEMTAGRAPANSMAEGVIILFAAALLVTPGILTDVMGFLCLVPACRSLARAVAVQWFTDAVKRGTIKTHTSASAHMHVDWPEDDPQPGPIIDVVPERLDPPRSQGDPDEKKDEDR